VADGAAEWRWSTLPKSHIGVLSVLARVHGECSFCRRRIVLFRWDNPRESLNVLTLALVRASRRKMFQRCEVNSCSPWLDFLRLPTICACMTAYGTGMDCLASLGNLSIVGTDHACLRQTLWFVCPPDRMRTRGDGRYEAARPSRGWD